MEPHWNLLGMGIKLQLRNVKGWEWRRWFLFPREKFLGIFTVVDLHSAPNLICAPLRNSSSTTWFHHHWRNILKDECRNIASAFKVSDCEWCSLDRIFIFQRLMSTFLWNCFCCSTVDCLHLHCLLCVFGNARSEIKHNSVGIHGKGNKTYTWEWEWMRIWLYGNGRKWGCKSPLSVIYSVNWVSLLSTVMLDLHSRELDGCSSESQCYTRFCTGPSFVHRHRSRPAPDYARELHFQICWRHVPGGTGGKLKFSTGWSIPCRSLGI